MKNNKGITLASLVLTIVVLLILASIFIYSGANTVKYTKYNKARSEISVIQTHVNSWYQEYKNIENLSEYKALTTQTQKNEYKNNFLNNYGVPANESNCDSNKLDETIDATGIENIEKYRYLSSEFLENKIGLNVSFDYLANIEERIVILFGGIKYNDIWYFTADDFKLMNVNGGAPINNSEFNLKQGYDKEIIIADLKFKKNDEEVDISKFKILCALQNSDNWNDVTASAVKYTDWKDNKIKYRIPVDNYGQYKIKISTTDNVEMGENYIDVNFKGNAPKLSEGMIPVIYDDTKKKWIITEETDPDWFDYTHKVWANVMLSDGTYNKNNKKLGYEVDDNELGSMFTWIPRYAYSITQFKVAKDGEGTTQNIFDVSYLIGITDSDQDNITYNTDYNIETVSTGSPTPKIVHPAFTFGGNKLTGFWTAKFEASMAEDNKNTKADNNVTTKTIKILPNVDSWSYINIGNSFLNCLNMKNNTIYGLSTNADTHLMKNIEWGAVAYLAGSQYGITPIINDSYTAGNDYKTNVSQSTTGNETGIYDLNGGSWERVAAYWDNGDDKLSENGTTTVFPSNQLNSAYAKYWDRYGVSQNEITQMNNDLWNQNSSANGTRKSITDDRYNLMKNIKGDAMYETINTYSYYGKNSSNNYLWLLTETDTSTNYGRSYYNRDYTLLGNILLPFLHRGGSWNSGYLTGVFSCYDFFGGCAHRLRLPTYNSSSIVKKGKRWKMGRFSFPHAKFRLIEM